MSLNICESQFFFLNHQSFLFILLAFIYLIQSFHLCWFFFFLLFKYNCLHFHPIMLPLPTHPHLPISNPPSLALSMCPSYMLLDSPPIIPYYPSLSSSLILLDCSLFQCIWLYFACLFVLLLRLHL